MGDITGIVRADLLLYSIVIDLILIFYFRRNSYRDNYSIKLFNRIIIAIAVITAFEAVSWFTGTAGNEAQIPIHYWSNFLFLGLLALPAAFGLSYLDYKILGNREKSSKRLFIYLIPTYINLGFAIYNLFDDGFLFTISDMNQYSRGMGVIISTIILYIFFILTVIFFYRRKNLISGRIVQSILIFFFLPIIGSILQMLAYGTTFGMPSYTLAAFIIFLILEKDEMGKDELTGLYTRAKLAARIKFKLKAREAFNVIMADVDGFKKINDNYGHSEGDSVLKKVAELMMTYISVEDMVCRYGGDEFLALIECKDDIGCEVVSRIRKALERYNSKVDYEVRISFGCLFVDDPAGVSIEEIIHIVDRKMYEDKEKGREQMQGS